MKIALLGYGKMGKVIERIALERGHERNRTAQRQFWCFRRIGKR